MTATKKTILQEAKKFSNEIVDSICVTGETISDQDVITRGKKRLLDRFTIEESWEALAGELLKSTYTKTCDSRNVSSVLARQKNNEMFPEALHESVFHQNGETIPFDAAQFDVVQLQEDYWIDNKIRADSAFARNMETIRAIKLVMLEKSVTAGEALRIIRGE